MPVLQSTVAPLEGRPRCSVPRMPLIKPERLKAARAAVEKAVKLKKIFSVQGPYPVIRTALWARGWVERHLSPSVRKAPLCHSDEDDDDGDDGDTDVTERMGEAKKDENLDDLYGLMSRLVRNETTYFYWTLRRDCIDYNALQNDQMTNHFTNAGTFTTKVGLCLNLRKLQWFDTADPDNFFPRCYRLGAEDEKQGFIEDFRRTACTSLLQYVVETSSCKTNTVEGERQKTKDSDTDKLNGAQNQFVGPEIIDRALKVCEEYLNILRHSDIDVTPDPPPSMEEKQWDEFLQDFYMVAHKGAVIRDSSKFVERCQNMLVRVKEVCPQLDIDGLNNIWIIKPGAKSRGRGIICRNRLDEILALVDTDRTLMKDSKWVVQKYLERPLLVYNTKFDLRQWFLVTDWNPLTIWFYNECYLRFSTQPYSTKILDSSVHLCNNSIQKHYEPSSDRHPAVPDDNMWSCSQFCAFLKQQGRKEEWASVVIPGMRQAVVHAVQTAQDLIKPRKASFELYGADFILGRDLRPWLLEINSSPTMASSTAVTARLCPAVQVDTLRVVLDHQADPKAYTGGFKLIYRQSTVEVPFYKGLSLVLEGVPIRQPKSVHFKQTVPSHPLVTVHSSQQLSTEEVEKKQKPLGHKPYRLAALCHLGTENQGRAIAMSTSPKRENIVQNINSVRRFCQSLSYKEPLRVHYDPQAKVKHFGVSNRIHGVTLVPRSFSFSFSPPPIEPRKASFELYGPESKSQFSAHREPYYSRSFLPQTTFEPQHRVSTQVCPSFRASLPRLETFRFRPNIVTGTMLYQRPMFSTNSSVTEH